MESNNNEDPFRVRLKFTAVDYIKMSILAVTLLPIRLIGETECSDLTWPVYSFRNDFLFCPRLVPLNAGNDWLGWIQARDWLEESSTKSSWCSGTDINVLHWLPLCELPRQTMHHWGGSYSGRGSPHFILRCPGCLLFRVSLFHQQNGEQVSASTGSLYHLPSGRLRQQRQIWQ